MRRPLKPFITEYKGRGSQPLAARRAHEDHASAPLVNETFLRNHAEAAHQAEDSYEAALRAADALFSNSLRPAEPAPGADIQAESPPGSSNGAQRGGRILRAIDEAPLPGLAELEEERAPKRRGRKPGSKNKPKLRDAIQPASKPAVVEYQWPEDEPAPAAIIPRPLRSRPLAPPARVHVLDQKQPSAKQRTAAPGYAARQDNRFGWVRTKLTPGQEWKRRLPKVCW